MRELYLQRYSDNKDCTQGILYELKNGEIYLHGYTLEDEYRTVKIAGETRIPSGRYELKLRKDATPLTMRYREKYDWFTWHIEITNVKHFTGVYIHIGNRDEHTEGCILLGDGVDNNRISEGSISNSTVSFKRFYKDLYAYLENGQVFLNIRNESALI